MAPLLKPEDCCILFIDPTRRNAERTDQADGGQDTLISRHALVQQAARVLDVPKFFAIHGDELDEREWIAQPCDHAKPRIYAVGSAGSMWSGSGLGAALAEEGKACLLLCGFWLERSVTFAALNALADGFDVFVLMDACPSCDRHAKCPAIDRLLQAGVVPLTTTQMVSEWAEGASDQARRAALRSLLAPTGEQ
ncbi:MAG: isochorismatase family protein [Hyphomicrobium sp.]|uniref:isochorismatase family protein n=1 Tax=Hyphomicrobium sp. TaxID=82 RepID=UPI001327F983|nr:isochorismatase family protein [Hyphomicrobium sp.]KAB2943522.1 MAG: isochorismatase family protein [Hyphomicrobium sp.]MBZ0209767.1 isochorismatase family protein [Hyphomicrobium sp.]